MWLAMAGEFVEEVDAFKLNYERQTTIKAGISKYCIEEKYSDEEVDDICTNEDIHNGDDVDQK